MTDREILEYSAQLINVKNEVETGESAEPDLNEQVKNKFIEDSVNRARFVDSTLVIGAASKEFRNVFGVDAPHYEISNDCFIAIDNNGNGKYDESEKIDLAGDPMNLSGNNNSKSFTDCWEVINAALFDSTTVAPDIGKRDIGNKEKKYPGDRQRFFVDSKKKEESSPFHNPVCAPGFNMWAGNKIYDDICKNFDLNEITAYKIFSNITENTIPRSYNLGTFSADNQFECNINEYGEITKNVFEYSFDQEYEAELQEAYSNGDCLMPEEGCKHSDSAPIKWYTVKVPVSSKFMGGKFYYTYDFTGTIFEKSMTPVVSFSLVKSRGKKEFNSGYAIICPDPFANLEASGSKTKSKQEVRFCVHILHRNSDSLVAGPNYTVKRNFLWWSWDSKEKQEKYTVTFNPINSVPVSVKIKAVEFIRKMEQDCVNYYNMLEERMVNTEIPDSYNTRNLMNEIITCSDAFLATARGSFAAVTKSLKAWNAFLNSLEKRVVYDITGKVMTEHVSGNTYYKDDIVFVNLVQSELVRSHKIYQCDAASTTGTPGSSADWIELKIFSTTDEVNQITKLQFDGSKEYITSWDSKVIPGWPKFLRRLFKQVSTPNYQTFQKIKISSSSEKRNFNYTIERKYSTGTYSYLGPSSGDFTKLIDSNGMKTAQQIVDIVLSEEDKTYLRSKGLLTNTYITVGSTKLYFNDLQKYDVVRDVEVCEKPTYDNVKRAQVINSFMKKNPDLFTNSFTTLADRINKRTGTLRKMCSLLESANINAQMIEQKKKNVANLFKYVNAYSITGGFDSKVATIKLATWEPYTSAYANLERMGTVYLLADNTELFTKEVEIPLINKKKNVEFFKKNFVKTVITDIIDFVSDTQYNYDLTEDTEVKTDKIYYIIDSQTSEYREAKESERTEENLNNQLLYERGTASAGPVFKVTLQDKIPKSFQGNNPRIVKVYN